MSKWLDFDEVLVGQGSGEAAPLSPRPRGLSAGSPRSGRGRSLLASPTTREAVPVSPQAETMGKAKELFVLCDKEGKGFITKRDMQRLQGELPLSPEQLETVFESLDRQSTGFLTPVEFNAGLGELVGLEDSTDQSTYDAEEDRELMPQYTEALRFVKVLTELGADKLFSSQQELCSLWCELQRDRPELLNILEAVLLHVLSHLQDSIRERDCLEQALCRRESEHDQVVRSIYEEMENQIREEREKHLAQDDVRQKQRGQQLEKELKLRHQELENILNNQKELETKILRLSCEQVNMKEQNQQLRRLNVQLQEQAESNREQLQAALNQLSLRQLSTAQEQVARQRNVMKVSSNMQKEKDSLLRQLELLRDMNKRLRDDKDAQTQKRNPNTTKTLQREESVIGNRSPQDKSLKRQLSPSKELEQDKETKELSNSSKRYQTSNRVRCENVEQTETQNKSITPQQVFKVVFLGNSGVGKSSFIQHFCSGRFSSHMSTTVGIDFQVKTFTVGSTTITVQLWDTAGQERYRSITEQYYRRADGILAMYDITHLPSFTAVRGWMDSVKEKMCDGTVLMLLGNKLDLADSHSRKVSTREGQMLAEQYKALFYECSAKTGCNMDELMSHLAGMLVTQHHQQREDALLLTEDPTKRSCCM